MTIQLDHSYMILRTVCIQSTLLTYWLLLREQEIEKQQHFKIINHNTKILREQRNSTEYSFL